MKLQSRESHDEAGVLLLVGTMKGAFLFRSDTSRDTWRMDGPHFRGQAVYALLHDARGNGSRILAATNNSHFGSTVRVSDDLGSSWSGAGPHAIRFPSHSGRALSQIWQLAPGRADQPSVLYCGVEPAALFESGDRGDSWTAVEGILSHEHQPQWQPGGGGLCLHTILVDPSDSQRMLVAISTGGVYRTDDGGGTWQPRNRGVRAEFLPDKHPEFGQCVHKVVHHPARPERLFLQNHWGLYRSDDWGDSWSDIANGVPSDFGFAMQMHPHDPDTVYILPLESDEFRCTPEGRLRVYRTGDAGEHWEALTRGLPQENAYETVLRDGMSADPLHPAGIYFGTRSGKLYGSADEGTSWREIADGLPSVVCVSASVLRANEIPAESGDLVGAA
ncbi:sialidase family protein [soil metagenome]